MKISQFPLIESVDGSEQLAIVKDGANGKMKTSAIIAKAKEGLVPQIAGKGLSTNDYTNADKAKLTALPTNEQFTIKGYFLGKRGNIAVSSSEITGVTTLLPLSKTYPIVLKNVLARGNAVAVCFYDAAGSFISYPEGIENLNGDFTVSADKYPASACYFIACSEKADSTYTHGPSIESREGAVSEAIQAAITAAADEELDAQAAAIGAIHNYTTGYFEYNTLTDITAEQMRKIILFGKTTFTQPGECGRSLTRTESETLNALIRTNWIHWGPNAVAYCTDLRYSFYSQQVEVIIGPKRNDIWNVTPSSMEGFCWRCPQLRIIDMYIYITNLRANEYLFNECPKLETVYLCAIKTSFNIIGAPLLSLASIQYMVDNAANTSPITITLHPDAHARLTEELVAQAAEKQITFATT